MRKTLYSLLAAAAIAGLTSGCATTRENIQKVRYGATETFDGVATLPLGVGPLERVPGHYNHHDPDAVNFKPAEEYTGKTGGDRIRYALVTPLRSLLKTKNGLGKVGSGLYHLVFDPIWAGVDKVPGLDKVGYAIDRVIDPGTKKGYMTDTVKKGVDGFVSDFGQVETDNPRLEADLLKNREGKWFNAIPAVSHLDDDRDGSDKFWDFIGETIYLFIPFSGKSSGGVSVNKSGGSFNPVSSGAGAK